MGANYDNIFRLPTPLDLYLQVDCGDIMGCKFLLQDGVAAICHFMGEVIHRGGHGRGAPDIAGPDNPGQGMDMFFQ